jgi:outer membrane protein
MMAVAGLLAVAGPIAAQAAPTKIAYIDTRRVINEAPGAQDARATLQREMENFQAQLQAMDDSLRTMMTEFQQRQLRDDGRREAASRAGDPQKQGEFEQRAEALQQQAGQRQQELMEPIMQRVEQVISEVRQAEGCRDGLRHGIGSHRLCRPVARPDGARHRAAPGSGPAARLPEPPGPTSV